MLSTEPLKVCITGTFIFTEELVVLVNMGQLGLDSFLAGQLAGVAKTKVSNETVISWESCRGVVPLEDCKRSYAFVIVGTIGSSLDGT